MRFAFLHLKSVKPTSTLTLNGIKSEILLDTGASVNILDECTYEHIGKPALTKHVKPKLYPYGGGKPLNVIGKCVVTIETKSMIDCHDFYVVKGHHGSLIGFDTANQLKLIQINNLNASHSEQLKQKYPGIDVGIGKLKNTTVALHIDKTIQPVAINNRRTPFHLRDKVENEINKLLDQDIIEKVEGCATPWVSAIVTPPKKNPNEIRLCVDMREPNKAILRERHQMPTREELIHDLNGARVFSKLDLRAGYHQIELEPDSHYITTFSTHLGLFRYKRLNFGICSAAEIFQETIKNVIRDIPGTKNISDDIIIYGKGDKAQENHDKALEATLQHIHDVGLTLNWEKCEFNKPSIDFFGLVFCGDGVTTDAKTCEAIDDVSPPTNATETRSILGMITYYSRFVQNFATISEPLRRLTKKDVTWSWDDEQQNSFEQLKAAISNRPVMAYYDPTKPTDVIVDASPVGLGAILGQEGHVVAYASRTLSDVETRYSQTEREALAVVWGMEHFDMYLRGADQVTVITDHQPLATIWQKPKPPLRIERWSLRLQPYKFTIRYKPGRDNPADYMSRHPYDKTKKSTHVKIAETYVNFITETSVPKAMTLTAIKEATENDPTLCKAMEFVRLDQWSKMKQLNEPNIDYNDLRVLSTVRDELTCHPDNILLRNNNIVIPSSLRDDAVKLAHEGHQGMERTKAFIRLKVWFPGINDRVEKMVQKCHPCNINHQGKINYEPLKMSKMPEKAWENLSMDFCGPLPSGDYLMVIVDEFSRYPVVEIIKSVSANTVIPVLDKTLSLFGYPKQIKTDNGSPFNSHAFSEFAKHSGFKHRRITPHWPRANAQAESFNKPLMKGIRAAVSEGKNWKQEMFKHLRQYRSTPHPSTGISPHMLLFGREPQTKLPQIYDQNQQNDIEKQAIKNDEHAKMRQKQYGDKHLKTKECDIKIGDYVIVKHESRQNKLQPSFDKNPHVVTHKNGNMITATSGNHKITRNSSRFRRVMYSPALDNTNNSDDDLLDDDTYMDSVS